MSRIAENDRGGISTAVDLTIHFTLAVVLAGFFYCLTGGWVWPALAVGGGIFIDMDHFIDYYRYFGGRFSAVDFFGHKYLASGKCYVILHSWELVLCVWILSRFFYRGYAFSCRHDVAHGSRSISEPSREPMVLIPDLQVEEGIQAAGRGRVNKGLCYVSSVMCHV